MKTYIPKQPKHLRERIEAKLDERLVRTLERYCQYLESDRDYVLSKVLEIVFRKDKGFAAWVASQNSGAFGEMPQAATEESVRPERQNRHRGVLPNAEEPKSGDERRLPPL